MEVCMGLIEDDKVKIFLNEINIIDHKKSIILNSLRDIVLKNYPESKERMMYGGIMFSLNDEFYSGLFVRKNHISLEFGKGFLMNDPKNILEGGGKFRRHLKIRSEEDVLDKEVDFFVKQAL